VGTTTGYELDGRGSVPGSGKISLFYEAFIPALGSTQFPTQWVPEALSPRVSGRGREVEVSNDGTIPPLPHTLSWRGA
jgi:hypothetical protein